MEGLALNALLLLITSSSTAKSLDGNETQEPVKPSNNCQLPAPDHIPPDFEDSSLDDILAIGISQINLQSRNASNGSLGAIFVFGNPGSRKSVVTQLIVGKLNRLNVGSTNSNSLVIYRSDDIFPYTSTTSKLLTLLPDYYTSEIDDYSQVAIWDCPGFGYSYGPKADVAQMYFLHHALNITKSAKFIFTITYSSIMLEDDVRGFATYVTTLIKHVGKFKDSIGLVVTEVDPGSFGGEEDILSSIRSFLKSYAETEKSTIENTVANISEASETNHALLRIGFIEGLLEDGVYGVGNTGRIYFTKIPDVCNAPANMSMILVSVAKLKELQGSTLKFSTIDQNDLGLPLKTATLQQIGKFIWAEDSKEVEKNAIESLRVMIRRWEKAIIESPIAVLKLETLTEFLLTLNHRFGQPNGNGSGLVRPEVGPLYPIEEGAEFLLICASQRIRTIRFIQGFVGDEKSESPKPIWSVEFQSVFSELKNITTFYIFCNETYHALGEHSNQVILRKMISKYPANQVNPENVLDFLANALKMKIPNEISNIWKKILRGHSKQYLVELVRKRIPQVEFSAERLIPIYDDETLIHTDDICFRLNVTGNNVMLSEVMDSYFNHTKDDNDFYSKCYQEILVVAVEKFYIDQNVKSGTFLKFLSVVSPVWEVVATEENRTIRLDGDGRFTGEYYKSHAGGGFFSGMYSKIINGNQLVITANGGSDENGCSTEVGGLSGSIQLISTSSKEFVHTESCPGSGKYPGGYSNFTYMSPYVIAEYNRKFIESSYLNCFPSESEVFVTQLNSSASLPNLELTNTPNSIVLELQRMEHAFYERRYYVGNCYTKIKSKMTVYYEKMLTVVNEMLELGKDGEDNIIALTMIGSLILSKLTSYRRLDITLNVVSTEEYLKALWEDLKELKELEIQLAVKRELEVYEDKMDEKIDEVENIISKTVDPAIKSAEKDLVQMNTRLLDTLNEFLEAAMDAEEQAKKMRNQFKSALPLKYLLSVLNIVGTIVSFFGPIGAGIGGALKAGSAIGTSLLDNQPTLKPLTDYAATVPKLTEQYFNNELDNLNPKPDNDKKAQELKEKNKKVSNIASKVALTAQLGTEILSFAQQLRSDQNKLTQLESVVASAEQQVQDIKKLKEDFHNNFVPLLEEMGKRILEETLNLRGKSLASLTIRKWELMNMLKSMRGFVQSFAGWISKAQAKMENEGQEVVGERGVYEKFQASIDTLDEAIVVLLELYAHIETYQEQKQFAQFVANVNFPTLGILNTIKNAKLKKDIEQLRLSMHANVLLEEYKKALRAFKQWVFPFSRYYLSGKNELIVKTSYSLDEVTSACREEIGRLRRDLAKYNSLTLTPDEFLYFYNFTSDAVSSRPFYVWTNDRWRDAISSLFHGKIVRLKADVDMIGQDNAKFFKNKAAIKFKFIQLFIKSRDKSRQDELDAILKHFRMRMTHSGVSLYKVNGRHFVMRDKSQIYRYNIERNIGHNAIKYKVESSKSDFLMSPFTYWTFRMRDLTGVGFEVLKNFSSNVDLVLEGSGTYLDEAEAGPTFLDDLNLSEYYNTYRPSDDEMLTLGEIPTEASLPSCDMALLSYPYSNEETYNNFTQTPPIMAVSGNLTREQICDRILESKHKKECQRNPE